MTSDNTLETAAALQPTATKKQIRLNIVSATTGTALEYFDFALYGLASALVFNQLFFPNLDPAAGFLASFATFGVGFFARAAGGVVLGYFGDRLGRKLVLMITIGLMGISTAIIGMLPTYDQVGLLAPILLVVLRLAQGFGAGAEIAGASTLLVEVAPVQRRGFVTSFVSFGLNIGTILASTTWLLVAALPAEILLTWGWRVPFLASVLVMLYTLYLRRRLSDSPTFEATAEEQKRITPKEFYGELFSHGRKAFLRSMGMRIGESGTSTFYQVFLIGIITAVVGNKTTGTSVLLIASFAAFAVIPTVGYLSDKFGRRPTLITIAVFQILWLYPAWLLIQTGEFWAILVAVLGGLTLGVIPSNVVQLAALPELFGSRHRYSGLAVSKEIGGMISGGIVPFVSAWISAATSSIVPMLINIGVLASFTLIAAVISPETRGRNLVAREDAV